MKNSDDRFLQALNLIKLKADLCQPIKFKGLCETFGISPGIKQAIEELGIISGTQETYIYQWICKSNPDLQMVKSIKNIFKRDKQKESVINENFDQLTIDDKINHIEFMLNQIFERVNYLFENLANKEQLKKVDSKWFRDNEATN